MMKAIFATRLHTCIAAVTVMAAFGVSAAMADDSSASLAIRNRTIGYVLSNNEWMIYTDANKSECPDGLNDGPREQYKQLYPEDGTKRKVVDTDLEREAAVWFPTLTPEPFKFKTPVSKIAPGLNLDGKVGPNDFTSPEGEAGIDNQFYRVVGCIEDHRPGGSLHHFDQDYMRKRKYTRTLMELTNVDSLANDDDVIVTFYRGLDQLLSDAAGNSYLPYGTQRVDVKWGKKFVTRFHGKIKDGVLTTDTADLSIPYNYSFDSFGVFTFRDARLKMNIVPERASGTLGGYLDINSFYRSMNRCLGTHSLSYGREAMPSIYRALHKYADAFPDANGQNTAISVARSMTFTQVFIKHPDQSVAEAEPQKMARKN